MGLETQNEDIIYLSNRLRISSGFRFHFMFPFTSRRLHFLSLYRFQRMSAATKPCPSFLSTKQLTPVNDAGRCSLPEQVSTRFRNCLPPGVALAWVAQVWFGWCVPWNHVWRHIFEWKSWLNSFHVGISAVRYDSDIFRSTNHLIFISKSFPWKMLHLFLKVVFPLWKCLQLVEPVIFFETTMISNPNNLIHTTFTAENGQSLGVSQWFFPLVDEVDGSTVVAHFCMDMKYKW